MAPGNGRPALRRRPRREAWRDAARPHFVWERAAFERLFPELAARIFAGLRAERGATAASSVKTLVDRVAALRGGTDEHRAATREADAKAVAELPAQVADPFVRPVPAHAPPSRFRHVGFLPGHLPIRCYPCTRFGPSGTRTRYPVPGPGTGIRFRCGLGLRRGPSPNDKALDLQQGGGVPHPRGASRPLRALRVRCAQP